MVFLKDALTAYYLKRRKNKCFLKKYLVKKFFFILKNVSRNLNFISV